MQPRSLTKLTRILGLLGSDQPGERASAALAAHRLVAANEVSWNDLLQPAAAEARRTSAYDVDYKSAAEARERQLRATNQRLEKQVTALRRRVAAMADRERARQAAEDAASDI